MEVTFQSFMDSIPDEVLLQFVERMMLDGVAENHWFEVKSGMPKRQIAKLSKLVSSISNTGGGIIFYGWDEENKCQVDADIDRIQGLVVQHSNLCDPSIEVKFRSISTDSKNGLFAGISAHQEIIKDKDGEIWYRSGSHVKLIEDEGAYSAGTNHLKSKSSGHLYLKHVKSNLGVMLVERLTKELTDFLTFLETNSDAFKKTIMNEWEINFEPWFNADPNFPLRIRFQNWIHLVGEPRDLQLEFLNKIDDLVEELDLIDQIAPDALETDDLRNLLKDQRIRNDLKNPKGARRCLYTLVNQQNIWNFAHARMFVVQESDSYIIEQHSSGSQFRGKIADLEGFDQGHIEEVASSIVKKAYVENVTKAEEQLTNEISRIIPDSY